MTCNGPACAQAITVPVLGPVGLAGVQCIVLMSSLVARAVASALVLYCCGGLETID